MRAFEFHDARKNLDPEGGGGSILAAFSLEGPTDTVHAKINREQTEKIEAAKVPVAPGNYDGGVLGGGRKAAAAGPNVFQLDLPCQAAEARSRAPGAPLFPCQSPRALTHGTSRLPHRIGNAQDERG